MKIEYGCEGKSMNNLRIVVRGGVDLAGLREGGDGHRKGEDEAEGADGYA